MLDLAGTTVTVDAVHCQRATARTIVARGGEYLMAVKSNQPALYDDIKLLMDDPHAPADSIDQLVETGHGRIETRRAEVMPDVGWLAETHDCAGLACIEGVAYPTSATLLELKTPPRA